MSQIRNATTGDLTTGNVTGTRVGASANLWSTGDFSVSGMSQIRNATTGDLTTGNVTASGLIVSGSTLVERVNGTERYGVGLSTTNRETTVYGPDVVNAQVSISFMTSGGALYDAINVVRRTTTANVGINQSNPSEALHVGGKILASDDITAFSDRKLKCNLRVISTALTRLQGVFGYTFDRVDLPGSTRHAGVIAQEIQAALPEAVHMSGDTLAVGQAGVSGLVIQSLKELADRVLRIERHLGLA